MSLVTSSILSDTFSPSSISSLILWYDMFSTNYILLNTSSISTLLDKSGYNNNASTNANPNSIASYIPYATRNGGGCIWFNSNVTNQWINVPPVTRESWSWFVLINGAPPFRTTTLGWSSGRGIIDGYNTLNASNGFGMSLWNSSLACGTGPNNLATMSTIYVDGLTNELNIGLPYQNEAFNICQFSRYSPNGYIEARINGGPSNSTFGTTGIRAIPNSLGFIGNGMTLGTNRRAVNLGLSNGRFYEILMYSTFLSTAERQQIEGYLAWKWGFANQLPIDHPYRYNPFIVAPDPTPTPIPDNAFLVPVNTYSSIKTLTLPSINEFPGRILVIKDYLGYANRNPIYISTQGADLFQDIYSVPTNYGILSTGYGAWTFQNDGLSKWFITSEYTNSMIINSANPTIYPSGPKIYLDPATSTFFPRFTSSNISTFPTNMGDYLNFSGTGNQWITFGSQRFNISTNGFALKMKVMHTQGRFFSRYIDFNNGASGVNDVVFYYSGAVTSTLFFSFKGEITANNAIAYSNFFSTNIIYNFTVNYMPSNAIPQNNNILGSDTLRNGITTVWIDGVMVFSNPRCNIQIPTDRTYVNTYIGRSSYAPDAWLAARIYKLAVYDRYLSDAECAYVW